MTQPRPNRPRPRKGSAGWSGFDFADRCSKQFLSREYESCPEGTTGLSPGFLTPGTDKKGTRPESGGREAFFALDAERDPQRISAAPLGRGPMSMCPGVETPGSVLSSLRDKEFYTI
jgi:hypothetical protein